MQRRAFVKNLATAAAVAVVTPSALLMDGCTVNVQALLNTVITAAEAVIKVAEPGAPWVAQLESAIAALLQAEGQWQGGSPVQIVISALNTIQAVLAVIPVTAVYSPLIAVLVAGIEAVLTALIPQAKNISFAAAKSPYYGRAKLSHPSPFHPTYEGAFKAQWNSTAEQCKLPVAKI